MKDSLGLPTHDDTSLPIRMSQRVPPGMYWVALALSAVLATLTLILGDDAWVARAAALSAIAAALSAAGFVFHSRPRVLRKHWSDLAWDPDMQHLVEAKIIDYESSADGVWVIRASEHRKGRFPSLRINERRAPDDPWVAVLTEYQVSSSGDIAVLVGVDRHAIDSGKDLQVIIS